MNKKILFGAIAFAALCIMKETQAQKALPIETPQIEIRRIIADPPLGRAQRAMTLQAVVVNRGDDAIEFEPRLVLPHGLRSARSNVSTHVRLRAGELKTLTWTLLAAQPLYQTVQLELHHVGAKTSRQSSPLAKASLPLHFLPPKNVRVRAYIPEPQVAPTRYLIGAHNCPLWETAHPEMWDNVLFKHPERMPALGFYSGENPQVADWETKWATEHGISFFTYCWYRTSQGGAIKTMFGSAIHDAFFKSRFLGQMKFTIMWENQARGTAGVADERDLMKNLLPYWIETYFKHPSYLKVDNKPVLFIYRPEFLIQDLGSEENVRRALDKMRAACRTAGFSGLTLMGEYRGTDPKILMLLKNLGVDYSFPYVWGVPGNPTPQQAADAQMSYMEKTRDANVLPQIPTISQAWSGWNDEAGIWKIPPRDFESLLRRTKAFMATLPKTEPGSRMLMLDNWNEWGEGHYLAPYREYGFDYLDAVRNVFTDAPRTHDDLLPQDIGLGPYDKPFRTRLEKQDALQQLVAKKVFKAGAPQAGLVGWWSFDEENPSPVALEYSGHKLGGIFLDAERTAGVDGGALHGHGGAMMVENHALLWPGAQMTLSCWVKTATSGQDNKWFINRVLGGGETTGYRMGMLEGKPCFEVPLTTWSHHLMADAPLPTNRWVHLAGTFDGQMMRIFVDGKERGSMARPGPIHPNNFPLCLGNFAPKHAAYFDGLLDEVKLFNRALSEGEVRAEYEKLMAKAGAASTR